MKIMKVIALIMILLTAVFLMTGCEDGELNTLFGRSATSDLIKTEDLCMYEWISPDGVHYWVYENAYGAAMAPRYRVNGLLYTTSR